MTAEPPKKKARPFDQIMKKVVFCLSGYQNPERGKIRDKALEMGASYKPDWGRGCTHLICAYDNTPKYNQVSGKGRITTRKWIDDCYKKQELLAWRKYRLGDADSPGETSESEEEKPKASSKRKAESPEPGPSSKKPALTKTGSNVSYGGETDEYDASTDEGGDTDDEIERVKASEKKFEPVDPYDVPTDEEDNNNKNDADPAENGGEDEANSLPELPSFFKGKTFFLYGTFQPSERRTMFRFISAYDGILVDYMNDEVNYVITNSTWDENFDEALSDNPSLAFVKPTWIHACDEKQSMVPHQKYVIVPK